MVYKHRVFLITRDGEREVASFRTRIPFCKSAFNKFRAIAQAFDSIQDVPILTPVKFVKNGTIAGGHYQFQNGDVLELRWANMNNHAFCRTLLSVARQAVKAAGWTLPRITVIRSTGNLYFVEADTFAGVYVKAHCAYEAKAKFIAALNDAKWGREI